MGRPTTVGMVALLNLMLLLAHSTGLGHSVTVGQDWSMQLAGSAGLLEGLGAWLQSSATTLLQLSTTLGMTFLLAWYVNYAVKRRLYFEKLTERRLKDLYRPMQLMLTASKRAFERYLSSSDEEERKSIAELWNNYHKEMKHLVMTNSHLFVESDLPPEITQLIEHIDAFSFDYSQYKQGKQAHPFPGSRGYAFPTKIEEYFTSRSRLLAESLQPRSWWKRKPMVSNEIS